MDCRHPDAQAQPGVAHLFVHALMQALTSQLTARADDAKATERPQTNIAERKVSDRRRNMDAAPIIKIISWVA
jgi:hypothetical protein